MHTSKPWSPRMVMWIIACLLAGSSTSVRAQEYSPVIEDRVESGSLQPPEADVREERRGGWDISAVISAAYDDNIFLSKTRQQADTVFSLAPTIAYSKGDDKGGGGGFLKVAYRPTAVVYVEHGSENRIDQQAVITAGWQGKASRIIYGGLFQQLGGATADTGRPTDRLEIENEVRAAWTPREKLTFEIAAGNRQVTYADPIYYDSNKVYGEVAVRYAYSPKTELGISTRIGRLEVDGSGPQDTQRIAGAIAWMPREKIRVELEAGAEHRNSDAGTAWNPVLSGRIDWKPRSGTEVYLAGYMRQEASAYYAGQNYQVNGFTAGLSQRLGEHWTARLEGGYERNTYEVVSGGGSGARNDSIWFVRPAMVRRIGEKSELSIFYRVSNNSSSDPSFGYDDRMLGIEFNHKF
jgi:hypothetical protein